MTPVQNDLPSCPITRARASHHGKKRSHVSAVLEPRADTVSIARWCTLCTVHSQQHIVYRHVDMNTTYMSMSNSISPCNYSTRVRRSMM